MNNREYNNIIELENAGGGWIPSNEKAEELLLQTKKGEVTSFSECTKRDLKFHKCYMKLLKDIWKKLPQKFKETVSDKRFYLWLKHLKGEYDVIYEFKDGSKLIEYDSISFGKMSQKKFEEYVSKQLPWIYENVIGAFFEGEEREKLIKDIEDNYRDFLDKIV